VNLKSGYFVFIAEAILFSFIPLELLSFVMVGRLIDPNMAKMIFFAWIPIFMSLFGLMITGRDQLNGICRPSTIFICQFAFVRALYEGFAQFNEIFPGIKNSRKAR
jgi:hypothetical protein